MHGAKIYGIELTGIKAVVKLEAKLERRGRRGPRMRRDATSEVVALRVCSAFDDVRLSPFSIFCPLLRL